MYGKRIVGFLIGLAFPLFPPEARAQEWRSDMQRDYRVVDYEKATGNLFIIADPAIAADEDSLVSLLIAAATYTMENRWNGKPFKVALFAARAYAHPKRKIPARDRKRWAVSFLAEYDTERREAWLYPALPAQRKKLTIVTRRRGE